MQAPAIFTQLEGQIGEYDLLRHPFYQAWSAAELMRRSAGVCRRV
jgi:pyrroloquinoline quinone (PQQ) biosynthesis protein C